MRVIFSANSERINREIMNHIYFHVETACNNSRCAFPDVWKNHIVPVVMYAKALAKKFGADEDVCEIAALFHDYAGVLNYEYYEQHHIHGAEIAGAILRRLNFPEDKIENVQHCIISHRNSRSIHRKTIEAEIVATADALAHIEYFSSLLSLAIDRYGMKQAEAKRWVIRKIEKSFAKMMPEIQERVKQRFDAVVSELIVG